MRVELGVELAGRTVIVGLSGGADSTALLLLLHYLRPRLDIGLRAAHLDHGLRAESAGDARFAASLCSLLGVPCDVRRTDVDGLARERSIGLEEAGRMARYAFFHDIVAQSMTPDTTVVALAHTLNDLAEDVLMRLLRGAGWPALGGMAGWAPDRALLRPLLLTGRSRIEAFVRSCNLEWVEDASNADSVFLRNRIRQNFLPLFLQENPNFLETIANLWRSADTDAAFFEEILESVSQKTNFTEKEQQDNNASRKALNSFSNYSVRLEAAELDALHPALRLRLFKKTLELLGEGQPLLPALRALEGAWKNRAVGRIFQFPGGKRVRVEADSVVFFTSESRK